MSLRKDTAETASVAGLETPSDDFGEPNKDEINDGADPKANHSSRKDDVTNHPRQVDFALLTINESESEAVHNAFGDCLRRGGTKVGNKGSYEWGETNGFLFVHASTRDWKGPIPTIEMIRELSHHFNPQYFLVLGTSGGVKKTPQIDYGQVVFSRQIHTGYVQLADGDGEDVIARLYDDPVPPPHKSLYFHAVEVSQNWKVDEILRISAKCCVENLQTIGKSVTVAPTQRETKLEEGPVAGKPNKRRRDPATAPSPWLNEIIESIGKRFAIPVDTTEIAQIKITIRRDKAGTAKQDDEEDCAPAENSCRQMSAARPEPTEFFSGPFLVDGRNSRIFQGIKTTFPKVGAVEMEAGGVAQALQHASGSGGPAGYLVIKGISDIIESQVPETRRREVRKALAPLASLGSALFARRLIESWKVDSQDRIGRLRILPPKYAVPAFSVLARKLSSNSVVFYKVGLILYSQLLKRLCEEERVTEAWIFSYLAPFRFFEDYPKRDNKKRESLIDEKSRMIEHLFSNYPHFQVFVDMSKTKPVTRIIHRGKNWDAKNGKYLEAFGAVNGENIHCYVIKEEYLQQEDRWPISDQVVLNGDLLLNYWYEDGKLDNGTLTMTYLDEKAGRAGFEAFTSHCQTMCNKEKETKYEAVAKEILARHKSESKEKP